MCERVLKLNIGPEEKDLSSKIKIKDRGRNRAPCEDNRCSFCWNDRGVGELALAKD